MAGDYIPFDHDFPEKRETLAIHRVTKCPIAEIMLLLFRFWRLVDRQTEDGVLSGVDMSTLSAVCGGDLAFWQAVRDEGWLAIGEDGSVIMPGFVERLGGTKGCARQRLKWAQQKRRQRARGGHVPADSGGHVPADKVDMSTPPEPEPESIVKPPIVPQGTKEEEDEKPPRKPRRSRQPAEEYSPGFEEFWRLYPALRKTSKREAWKAWRGAVTRGMPAVILAAAKEFAASPKGRGPYCPGPAPWLNQDRWQDDRAAWQDSGERTSGPHEPVEAPMKEY